MNLDPGGTAAIPHAESAVNKASPAFLMAVRIVLLLAALLACGLYLRATVRDYRAFLWTEDGLPDHLKVAAGLEPSNAEFRYRMGRYSLLTQDFPNAISELQAAIALNPFDSRYWLELANAFLATDDVAGTERALGRALEADPTAREVNWQAANYELVQGDTALAMRRFHDLVEHDPGTLPATLNVCWRATEDADLIADKVLPVHPDAYFTFLRFLRDRPEDLAQVWSRLIALKQPFSVQLAFPYVDYLIGRNQFSQAEEAWEQVAIANPSFRAYLPSDNRIVNSSFELDLLDGGLDWRYSAQPGASVFIDDQQAHSGNRSLAITFQGSPADSGVLQLVPVSGNTRYKFSGFMMADNLETISPPRFAIVGLRGHKQYLVTDGVSGSTSWQELQGEFTTGPEDDLLLVHIARAPNLGQRLIRGRIWVDDVTLVPEP